MRVRDEEEAAEGPKDEEEVQDVEAEYIVTDRLNKEWGRRNYIGVIVPLWLEFGAQEAEVGDLEMEIEEDWGQKRHVGDEYCTEPE